MALATNQSKVQPGSRCGGQGDYIVRNGRWLASGFFVTVPLPIGVDGQGVFILGKQLADTVVLPWMVTLPSTTLAVQLVKVQPGSADMVSG